MDIDPASFNAFVVHAANIEERYFSGSAEIAEQWFKVEHPTAIITKIVSDDDYNAAMWGKI